MRERAGEHEQDRQVDLCVYLFLCVFALYLVPHLVFPYCLPDSDVDVQERVCVRVSDCVSVYLWSTVCYCVRDCVWSDCAVRQPQHVNTLRHFATFGSSSSRCGLLHRNATSDSLSSSGKQAPKQTNQKSKTPRSHTGSTTHVIRDPKPDPFGASSSSSQAHLLQTLLAPTCDLVVPLLLC